MSVPPFLPPVKQPLHPFGWIRPAGSSEYRVTQMYSHVNPAISSTIHGGMDMGNGSLGGPLFAPADGEVIAEGWLLAPWSSPSTRWPPAPNYGGIMVIIWHGGYISALAHMKDTIVNKGQTVKAGQLVGHLGATGAAKEFGGHVHWDLYRKLAPGEPSGELRAITYANAQWRKVDPWPLLAQNYVAPPDTSIATPKEDTMLRAKAEAWRTGPDGADIRETPGGTLIRHVGPGLPVSTLGETLDGKDRIAHVGVDDLGLYGALAYIARAQLVPFVAGGDPAFDKAVWTAVELRRAPDAPATGPTPEEVAALVKAGRQAGARDTAKAATDYAAKQ